MAQPANPVKIILVCLTSKPPLARPSALMATTHFQVVQYANHVVNGAWNVKVQITVPSVQMHICYKVYVLLNVPHSIMLVWYLLAKNVLLLVSVVQVQLIVLPALVAITSTSLTVLNNVLLTNGLSILWISATLVANILSIMSNPIDLVHILVNFITHWIGYVCQFVSQVSWPTRTLPVKAAKVETVHRCFTFSWKNLRWMAN